MTHDNKGYNSSTHYQPNGVSVLSNGGAGFQREVHAVDDLAGNDLINLEGMQMTAAQAREMGLLGHAFGDAGLNSASPTRQSDEPKPEQETVQKSETGHAAYDEAIDALNAMIDEGSMSFEEGQVYDASLAEIAYAGLQVDEVANTLSGLADGSIDEADVPADVRAMAAHVETQVTQAATKAAINELGKPAFDALTNMAETHAGVAEVIQRYAVDRAQGRHEGVTWADLYADINDELGNT